MATPYFQVRLETVASTQDEAKSRLDALPVAVAAPAQSAGRGRSGSGWLNADRAVAVSLAAHPAESDHRPLSLMAGVAAVRVTGTPRLKWPNDLMLGDVKVGGVLVEKSGGVAVIGMGLNIWWDDPPDGMGCLLPDDPGEDHANEVAVVWTANMMRLLDQEGWPHDEYRALCQTLGRVISWEPGGSGLAVDVANDGGLVVSVDGSEEVLYSGAVRHMRG
ncbi:MAG: hypothetical protein R3258_04135 [Acidimicrobiia bacterium]|nr:hypothetical protein [Acidimicrobiia bacterium]